MVGAGDHVVPSLAANLVVVVHLGFILFATLGGLLALRWRWVVWLHLPAAAWAAFVEITGGVCPLTPLENNLRSAAGQAAYTGDFVERYLLPIIYPAGLTYPIRIGLAIAVLAVNGIIYAAIWRKRGSALEAV